MTLPTQPALLVGTQYYATLGELPAETKAILRANFICKDVQPRHPWSGRVGLPPEGKTLGYYFRDNEQVRTALKINFGRDQEYTDQPTDDFQEPQENER